MAELQTGSLERFYPKEKMTRPHVEIDYNADALRGNSTDSEKNIAIIGSATDGDPSKIYELTNMIQAKSIFGSGEIIEALSLIWNPSRQQQVANVNGGGKVYAIRSEDAKPASLDMGAIKLVSKVYGNNANKIGVKLDKNPVTGSYRLTVSYPTDSYTQVYDNLGQLFRLSYTGEKAVATYSVEKASDGTATKFVLKLGDTVDTQTVVKTYDLTIPAYSHINAVMQDIQLMPEFSAEILPSGADSSLFSKFLDEVTDVNIKVVQETTTTSTTSTTTSTTTERPEGAKAIKVSDDSAIVNVDGEGSSEVKESAPMKASVFRNETEKPENFKGAVVTANLGDIGDKLTYDAYVSATIDLSKTLDSEGFDLTYLAGGQTGTVPVSWADKLQYIAQTDAYYVVPLTESSSVHAETKAFINDQNVLGHNMRAFVGGGFNETLTQSIVRQSQIKDPRVALVGNSGYFNDWSTGASVHLKGYMMGALASGVQSGLQIGGALTNKYVDITSLDQNFTGADLDKLNQNGVITVERLTNRGSVAGFRFVQDVTTYNSTNEPVKSRISLGEETDFLFDSLRFQLEKRFIGTNIEVASATVLKSFIESFLGEQKRQGVIVDFSAENITVVINGNTAQISFTVAPSQTLDNIYVEGAYENFTSATNTGTTYTSSNSIEHDQSLGYYR